MCNSLLCITIDGKGDEVRTAKDVRLLISKYVEEIAVRRSELENDRQKLLKIHKLLYHRY